MRFFFKNIFFSFFLCLSCFLLIWSVSAEPSLSPDDIVDISKSLDKLPWVKDDNQLEENFMPAVMKLIIGSVGWVATVLMLFSGIRMVTSFGDSEQRESAKKMLYFAILGIVFIVLAYAIVKGITKLQFDQVNPT